MVQNQGILVPWRCEIEGGSANVVAHFGNTAKEEPHFSNINQIMNSPTRKEIYLVEVTDILSR